MANKASSNDPDSLVTLFKKYDKNDEGEIDFESFKELCKNFARGEPIHDKLQAMDPTVEKFVTIFNFLVWQGTERKLAQTLAERAGGSSSKAKKGTSKQRREHYQRLVKLTEEIDLDEMSSGFTKFDQNKDGRINHQEWKGLLKHLTDIYALNPEVSTKLMNEADLDHNQFIDFEEFTLFATKLEFPRPGLNRLKKNFDTFPSSTTGRIPMSRFQLCLANCVGRRVNQTIFDSFATQVNSWRDCTVSFSEFVRICAHPDLQETEVISSPSTAPDHQLEALKNGDDVTTADLKVTSRVWKQASFKSVLPKYYIYSKDQCTFHISSRVFDTEMKNKVDMKMQNKADMKMKNKASTSPNPPDKIYNPCEDVAGAVFMDPPMSRKAPLKTSDPISVLFFDCGSTDSHVYRYNIQKEGVVELVDTFTTKSAPLREYCKKIRLLHVASECEQSMQEWLEKILAKWTIPDEELRQVDHVVVSAPSNIRRFDPRLKDTEALQTFSRELRRAIRQRIKFTKPVNPRFMILSDEAEANCEWFAAKHLHPEMTSVFAIDSIKCQASGTSGQIASCVGSMTALNRGIARSKLWESKLLEPMRVFKFGSHPLFISGFYYSLGDMLRWIEAESKKKKKSAHAMIAQQLNQLRGDCGMEVDEVQKAMTSGPVQEYLECTDLGHTGFDTRSQDCMFYFQQIVVCVDWSSAKEETTGGKIHLLFRNRFPSKKVDGTVSGPMKITFSLGWLLLHRDMAD